MSNEKTILGHNKFRMPSLVSNSGYAHLDRKRFGAKFPYEHT